MTPHDQMRIVETLRQIRDGSRNYLAENMSQRYVQRANVTEEQIAKEQDIIAGLEQLINELDAKLSS